MTYLNKFKPFNLIIGIIFISNSDCFAQLDTNLFLIKLPALATLIDSAYINSPLIQSQELIVEQKKIYTSIEKKAWLNSLFLNSNYSRGTNNAQTEGVIVPTFTKTSSDWYNAGLSFNISLATILNRKNFISISKINHEIEINNLQEGKKDLQKLILKLYTEVLMYQKILKIRNDALVVSSINYSYAEIEYQNNSITLTDFTRIHESTIKSTIFYEEAKRDYLISIGDLEEAVGIKLR